MQKLRHLITGEEVDDRKTMVLKLYNFLMTIYYGGDDVDDDVYLENQLTIFSKIDHTIKYIII